MQNIETVLVMVDGAAQYAIIPPHLLVGGEGKSPSNLRHLVTATSNLTQTLRVSELKTYAVNVHGWKIE